MRWTDGGESSDIEDRRDESAVAAVVDLVLAAFTSASAARCSFSSSA